MKDLSFFLLKNTLGAKMKKGIRNFCNGDGSTSTLNQQHKPTTTTTDHDHDHRSNSSPPLITSPYNYLDNIITADLAAKSPPTLEEMIMQLDLEEEIARKAKRHQEYYYGDHQMQRRMSCVNTSDILRSARNALNQYPRFSLDGKDAMYRSSFRNVGNIGTTAGRKSICRNNINGGRDRLVNDGFECLPSTLAGESVVWCKPGVVAKLMGLEAVPVVISRSSNRSRERFISSIVKKQNMRRMAERHEMERRSSGVVMGLNGCGGIKRKTTVGSCSKTGYCVVKPIEVEPVDGGAGWRPTRRFV